MSSTAQVLANRANAQRSTGPTSQEGKATSSGNAFKHGLTSSRVVLPHEDPDEFVALQARLRIEQAPVGELETHLVEDLAAAIWRLRRIREQEVRLIQDTTGLFVADSNMAKGFDRLLRYMGSTERQIERLQRQLKLARQERGQLETIQLEIQANAKVKQVERDWIAGNANGFVSSDPPATGRKPAATSASGRPPL